MSATPSLSELIQIAIDSALLDVHVALPGRVTKVDLDAGTVDVQPLIKRVLDDEQSEPVLEVLPVIPSVPVMWNRTRRFTAGSFPLEAGDTGLLIFNEQPFWPWWTAEDDTTASPGDMRRHSLESAVFVPGLYKRKYSTLVPGSDESLVVGSVHENGTKIVVPDTGAAEVRTQSGSAVSVAVVNKIVSAISAMLGAGAAAGGPGAANFTAAKTGPAGWDTVMAVPGAHEAQLGATKLKAE